MLNVDEKLQYSLFLKCKEQLAEGFVIQVIAHNGSLNEGKMWISHVNSQCRDEIPLILD